MTTHDGPQRCEDCGRTITEGTGHLRGCIDHESPESRHPFGNALAAMEEDRELEARRFIDDHIIIIPVAIPGGKS